MRHRVRPFGLRSPAHWCRARHAGIVCVLLALIAPPLRRLEAQGAAPPAAQAAATADTRAAADAITAAEIARHVGVIAHDSMRGRDTPSPGLEHAAQYVAAQFKAAGLTPAGDSGQWIQRYTLPGRAPFYRDAVIAVLYWTSSVKKGTAPVFTEAGQPATNGRTLRFGTTAFVASDTMLDYRAPGAGGGGQATNPSMSAPIQTGPPLVVVAGAQTLASVREAKVRNRVVVYVPQPGSDSTLQRQVLEELHTANHVIVAADEDSVAWAARRRVAEAHPPVALNWFLKEARRPRRWLANVWAPALQDLLATAGFDLTAARTAQRPIVHELRAVASVYIETNDMTAMAPAAPNTLGLLQGEDANQVIVLTAHMDHTGLRPGHADSIANGADDNASGVAGLIAVAKAYAQAAQAGKRPRRSIVFAAVSGGAKDFWGSSSLLDRWEYNPFARILLNINLDMIGHAAGDSLWIDGLQDVELPVRPEWLAAMHPELDLTVVDGGSAVAPASDHFAFVRKAIPSLSVHVGVHGAETTAAAADTPASVDAAQAARIARFVFAFTQELADAPQRPRWTAEGRRRRGDVFGQ